MIAACSKTRNGGTRNGETGNARTPNPEHQIWKRLNPEQQTRNGKTQNAKSGTVKSETSKPEPTCGSARCEQLIMRHQIGSFVNPLKKMKIENC